MNEQPIAGGQVNVDTTPQELLQRAVLGHSGLGISEYRIISKGVSEYVEADEEVSKILEKFKETDIYISINPRNERSGTNDAVSYLTCLVIDIDPVRPRGEASTEEQHGLALDVG